MLKSTGSGNRAECSDNQAAFENEPSIICAHRGESLEEKPHFAGTNVMW